MTSSAFVFFPVHALSKKSHPHLLSCCALFPDNSNGVTLCFFAVATYRRTRRVHNTTRLHELAHAPPRRHSNWVRWCDAAAESPKSILGDESIQRARGALHVCIRARATDLYKSHAAPYFPQMSSAKSQHTVILTTAV